MPSQSRDIYSLIEMNKLATSSLTSECVTTYLSIFTCFSVPKKIIRRQKIVILLLRVTCKLRGHSSLSQKGTASEGLEGDCGAEHSIVCSSGAASSCNCRFL